MNKVREFKIDSTLWATPARIINLLDFNPEKLTIDKELNSIHNTPDASSKDLMDIHQVRYENGGFYLTIDNIKGYFKLDGNAGILDMILFRTFIKSLFVRNLKLNYKDVRIR